MFDKIITFFTSPWIEFWDIVTIIFLGGPIIIFFIVYTVGLFFGIDTWKDHT